MLSLAVEAGTAAAEIHRQYRRDGFTVSTKLSAHDLVTEVDRKAEAAVVAIIEAEFPNHTIVGEEGDYPRKDSPYVWYIDPLDGTTNFIHGLPNYAASIACFRDGIPAAAVIVETEAQRTYTAARGMGAACNGTPILVSPTSAVEESLFATGFFYERDETVARNLEAIRRLFAHGCRGIRRFGSAALDLCHVAAGRVEGFWEPRLKPWDFAAGMLIVEEAGGRTSNQRGDSLPMEAGFVVASNGRVHDVLLSLLGAPRDEAAP